MRSTVSALVILLVTSASVLPTTAIAASRALEAASMPAATAPVSSATEAEAFLAGAEQELADVSKLQFRAGWVNSTYITDDTDVLAAYFGSLGTEMGSPLRPGSHRYLTDGRPEQRRQAQARHPAQRSSICRHPTAQGAAARAQHHRDPPEVGVRKRQGTHDQPISGSDIEDRDGHHPRSGEAEGDVDELARQCRRADARGLLAAGEDRERRRAQELGYADVGAFWRSATICRPRRSCAHGSLWPR